MWYISEALAKVVLNKIFAKMVTPTKFDSTEMRSPCSKTKYLYKNNTTDKSTKVAR